MNRRDRFTAGWATRFGGLLVAASVLTGPVAAAQDVVPFTYVEDNEPSSLHPSYVRKMVEVRMNELIFEGLFTTDQYLKPVGELAKQWTVRRDNKAIDIELYERYWHGPERRPVTADDVLFTIQALQDERSQSTKARAVSFIRRAAATCAAGTDPCRNVRLEFTRPIPEPERFLVFKILPAHKFPVGKPLKMRGDPFHRQPIGSGPFKFLRRSENIIGLERATEAEDANLLSRVNAQFMPDKELQVRILNFGNIHSVIRILPKDRAVVEKNQKVSLKPYSTFSWWYIGLNHRNPHLQDLNVRKAIAMAIDRTDIRKSTLGDGETITGPFSPRSPYYNKEVKPHETSGLRKRARAKKIEALMRKAGYRRERRGPRYFVKKKFRVNLTMKVSSDLRPYQLAVLNIQTALQRAGFRVSLRWLEASAYQQVVREKKDFDMTVSQWTFSQNADVRPLFHSEGRLNYINYRLKEMDRRLDEARSAQDPDVLLAINARIHELAHDDLPYIFLWSLVDYSAVSRKLSGVRIHPYNYFAWTDSWRWR